MKSDQDKGHHEVSLPWSVPPLVPPFRPRQTRSVVPRTTQADRQIWAAGADTASGAQEASIRTAPDTHLAEVPSAGPT